MQSGDVAGSEEFPPSIRRKIGTRQSEDYHIRGEEVCRISETEN